MMLRDFKTSSVQSVQLDDLSCYRSDINTPHLIWDNLAHLNFSEIILYSRILSYKLIPVGKLSKQNLRNDASYTRYIYSQRRRSPQLF